VKRTAATFFRPAGAARLICGALLASVGAWLTAADVPVKITVALDDPGHAVSPMLHGIFFEDINYAADGGLYAELVQNRSFEHAESLYAWSTVNRGGAGEVAIETDAPLNAKNPHYARLAVRDAGKAFGLANDGFGGIAVTAGENYLVSLRARGTTPLRVAIEDETGRPLGECRFDGLTAEWEKFDGTIRASGPATHARLVVLATAAGRVDLDMVSLFPEHTFKQRRNGVRADLAQMLVDLKPAFMRFPGGCIVEGMDLPNRYQWKDTIGDIAERPQNWNRWQDAIRGQTAPQYYQTYGLGFFEFFQLCEDLGCEPVPILNCGMACQYQSKQLVPLAQLDPFVQDALDLVEFANGPVTSPWGSKRAAMGHPEPFGLKLLGIGNEQWGEDYFARYQIFAAALRRTHPEIQLVSGAGPGVDDGSWKLAWDKFRGGTPADVVDEHYYRPPQWFLENATRYDAQPRTGPRVFAGEFAAHDGRGRRPTLRAAISEAAFMTGLVRNSDLVAMSSYAPLFAKAGAFQWQPDLIWFDNTHAYGTASYFVQALFSRNRPDVAVPVTIDGPAVSLPPLPASAVATYGATPLPPFQPGMLPAVFVAAGRSRDGTQAVMFLVNPYPEARAAAIELRAAPENLVATRTVLLTSKSADDENSFESPRKIAPHEETLAAGGSAVQRTLPPYSLTVLSFSIRP
jgi:alpha-L-arabinofuranosidase